MKKTLLIIPLLFLAIPMLAQSDKEADQNRYGKGKMPFTEDGRVVFSKIVSANECNADKIFNSVRLCITELFNSANDVIQMEDKESHILVCKGFSKVPTRGLMGGVQAAQVWYTLKIQTKDGRYKIDIYDIKGHYPGGVVNGIYLNPADWPAEALTYEVCFKPNGKMETAREGFYRRAIIDGCNDMMTLIESKIMAELTAPTCKSADDW